MRNRRKHKPLILETVDKNVQKCNIYGNLTKLPTPFKIIGLVPLLKIMAIKIVYSDKVMANIINGHYFFVY